MPHVGSKSRRNRNRGVLTLKARIENPIMPLRILQLRGWSAQSGWSNAVKPRRRLNDETPDLSEASISSDFLIAGAGFEPATFGL